MKPQVKIELIPVPLETLLTPEYTAEGQRLMKRYAAAEEMEKALIQVKEMIDIALPQFDWGKSFLGADGIQLLNEAPIAVNAALIAAGVDLKTLKPRKPTGRAARMKE